jgi:hypothetical protein
VGGLFLASQDSPRFGGADRSMVKVAQRLVCATPLLKAPQKGLEDFDNVVEGHIVGKQVSQPVAAQTATDVDSVDPRAPPYHSDVGVERSCTSVGAPCHPDHDGKLCQSALDQFFFESFD